MRETPWIEWTRTRLQPQESEDLRRELTSAQKARLLEHDYVWVEGIGVLWNPPAGNLRRARFTHGTHFETKRGEFYIDRDGSARKLSNGRFDHGAPTACPPSLPAMIDRYDGPIDKYERSGKSGGFDDAVPRPNAG